MLVIWHIHLKKQKKTLTDFSHELDHLYGLYREDQVSIELKEGQSGVDFVDQKVLKGQFLELGKKKILLKKIDPQMGIVVMELDSLQILVRPSGTEPKVKFYLKLGPFKGNEQEASAYLKSVASGIKTLFG